MIFFQAYFQPLISRKWPLKIYLFEEWNCLHQCNMEGSLTKILMRCFIFFTLFSALISVAAAQALRMPDEPEPRDTVSSQDYAITMSIPDTRSTVFPQEVVPKPLVPNGSNSWTTPENDYSMQRPSDFDQLTETGTPLALIHKCLMGRKVQTAYGLLI